jgi:C1A family cysteine protease
MPDEGFTVTRLQQILAESGAQWEAGVTPVSELSQEQKCHLLGYVPGPNEESLEQRNQASLAKLAAARAAAVGYPASYDWRNAAGKNFITPIKDQAGCGSCVAFGTVATVESAFRVQRGDPNVAVDLSEASLFFCIGPGAGAGSCPDGGWNMPPALDGFKNTGVPDEACFPYTDQDQACHQCADWQSRAIKITGWHTISSPADMKQWLSTRGPLATCFTVYEDFFAYKSGVYSHVSGDRRGGHCVSCVGYNDVGGFWICKNSWGAGFGESGYFRIAYGQVGIDSTMWAIEGTIQTGTTYSGVWRSGSDPYYLWVNASWDNFSAKWDELSKQNLRLVDLEPYTAGGKRVWAGVWRAGSDAHYLWVNANWDNFKAKWDELSKQNLRLTVLTTYEQGGTRLYAGVWRAGSDPYYLWVNANWDDFMAKWDGLGKQNLRLIHLETWTPGMAVQAGDSDAGQGGVGKGGDSDASEVGMGEGGGSDVGQVGMGEGGGSDAGQVGMGEGGGNDVGQVGMGEGGGNDVGQVGMGEGGGNDVGQIGVGVGGGSY